MTLNERIAALSEISPQTVKGNFTFEELKFEILNVINKEPNYEKIFSLFNEIPELLKDQPYHIINERIMLKATYLSSGLGLDPDLVNVLLCVEPLIKLDIELNNIMQDNEIYKYIEDLYFQHRKNLEMNFAQLSKMISEINFEEYIKEMQGEIQKLNNLAK